MTDVVVGVGNPVMTDDGIGEAVVDALHERRSVDGEGIQATHTGTTAFLALEAMSGADRAVIVDAVALEAEPGTIHRFEFDGDDSADIPDVMMHDFALSDALGVGADTYDLPEEIVLIGVVPANLSVGMELTELVQQSLPRVVNVIETELGNRDGTDALGGTGTMESNWYCMDCEENIEAEAVEKHEAQGHEVQGKLRPDRLLKQNPSDGKSDSEELSN